MSDYVAARIRIGGRIPVTLVPELCTVITGQHASLEWGDARFRPNSAEDLLEARREEDGVRLLWLYDDQARWGRFDNLEQFLQTHGIPFSRRSDGKYEYDPEIVEYRPEYGSFSMLTNRDGEPVVPVSKLATVESALEKAAGKPTTSEMIDSIRVAQRLLRKLLPPTLPTLEPLEIETDEKPESSHT
jgi:hypothetical protein